MWLLPGREEGIPSETRGIEIGTRTPRYRTVSDYTAAATDRWTEEAELDRLSNILKSFNDQFE